MISKQVFNTIQNVCKIKNPEAVFGGIQILFCGDFFQLPPVANPMYGDQGEYCFQSQDFNMVFPHRVVLNENVRQREHTLIKAINEVYAGRLSLETENFILSLNRPLLPDVSNPRTLKLFSRNDLADDYNRKCLLEFPGTIYEFKSSDQGKAADLSNIPAPHVLWLKIGCPVLLLRNLTNKLVNGLQGYLKGISDEGSIPIVEFPSVGVTIKIPKVKFTVFSPRLNTDIAVREQYPLKPAFGLTIHKAQGMTLSRVEVDCREIFKAGQLGVAMSMATTAAGIRVINFHPRYIIPPPETVKDFMEEPYKTMISDLTCCKKSISSPSSKGSTDSSEEIGPKEILADDEELGKSVDIEDVNRDSFETEDFDDEFDTVISSIISNEAQAIDFEIPEAFNIDIVMQDMIFKKEVTDAHICINEIINRVEHHRLNTFVKKLFLKLANFITKLTGKKTLSSGIPEKNIAQFYQLVHDFCTSADYKMDCLLLFETEETFSDNHMIVCYGIVEEVRLFYLKQKVDLMKITSGNIVKRHVTNASRARVRYVAGYCLASLRKKYVKLQKSNMYSNTKQGQDTYIESNMGKKCIISV